MSHKPLTFQQIRNATGRIVYNGLTLLVDPILDPKGECPGFELATTPERKAMRNPLIDLPCPIEDILKDLEAVILTHTHLDHWEALAARLIPKYINNSDILKQKKKIDKLDNDNKIMDQEKNETVFYIVQDQVYHLVLIHYLF